MFEKTFWRVKVILFSLDKIILAFIFETKKHPWIYIFDYIILPSETRYARSTYYLKKYFKVTEVTDGFLVDFNKFLMFFTKKEWGDEKSLVALFPLYFDLIYTQQVKYPISIIISEGPYETKHTPIKSDDIVFDIGANIGFFTLDAAGKAKKGQVYAFEPIETLCERIKKSCSTNKLDNVTIVPYAAGSKTGALTFHLDATQLLTGGSSELSTGKKLLVQQTSIDEYVQTNEIPHVDFIKMDIEGMEPEALRGARQTLKKHKPRLAICTYHHPDHPKLLEDIIIEANPSYIITHGPSKLYAF